MIEAGNKTELVKILCDRYGVSDNTVYIRLRKLGFKGEKKDGLFYLDDDQEKVLNDLDHYLRTEENGTITKFMKERCTDILPTNENGVTPTQKPQLKNQQPTQIFTSDGAVDQMAQLIANAQQKAGGILLAERALTAQYLANPELLNQELQDQIAEWESKCLPYATTAEEYASHLMAEFCDS